MNVEAYVQDDDERESGKLEREREQEAGCSLSDSLSSCLLPEQSVSLSISIRGGVFLT